MSLFEQHRKNTYLNNVSKGIFAASIATTIVTPIERIQYAYNTNSRHASEQASLSKIVKIIFRKEGIMGLLRGNIHRVMWMAPKIGATVGIFTTLRRDCDDTIENYYASAALAGLVAETLFYPHETIRLRFNSGKHSTIEGMKFSSYFDCANKVILEEGI